MSEDEYENTNNSDGEETNKPVNPLVLAERLRSQLTEKDIESGKEEIIEQIKNIFIASRMETASLQEQLRAAAITGLLEKVNTGDMTANQLLRVIETTNVGGEKDLNSLLGGKGGALINIDQRGGIGGGGNNQSSGSNSEKLITKDAGKIINAITSISQKIGNDSEIIDVTPENITSKPGNDS